MGFLGQSLAKNAFIRHTSLRLRCCLEQSSSLRALLIIYTGIKSTIQNAGLTLTLFATWTMKSEFSV